VDWHDSKEAGSKKVVYYCTTLLLRMRKYDYKLSASLALLGSTMADLKKRNTAQ
jgi:hypothetical protein